MDNCLRNWLEIVYYIAFVVLTAIIAYYAYKTYRLESSRKYELLCKLSIREETIGSAIFGYSLEVFNAGNKVAKKVKVSINAETVTTIDFIKPSNSAFYPLGNMLHLMLENKPLSNKNSRIIVNKGEPLKVILTVDGAEMEYSVNTDILFATRGIDTGTLAGIEGKLDEIAHAINAEYQRMTTGYRL